MKTDPRDWLHKPWLEDGATVATNGHLCIRVDSVLSGDIAGAPHHTMVGRVPKIIGGAAHLETVVSALDIGITKVPCRECSGHGFATEKRCLDCAGDGEFQHGNHWYSCKECDGDGIIINPAKPENPGAKQCGTCSGSGHDWKSLTSVRNTKLANRYLALLQDLPNCRLALPELPDQPVRFDFDGGAGVLMPMRD